MRPTIFLTLEPYLAQWLIHENEGNYPIPIRRGSAEAEVLQLHLRKRPKGYAGQKKAKPGQVEIFLPAFKNKDTRIFCYLPPEGEVSLHQTIRTRFKVKLWKDLHTVGNVVKRTDISISEWMTAHGIEVDDTNWNTIAKILQRNRAVYSPDRHLKNLKFLKNLKK